MITNQIKLTVSQVISIVSVIDSQNESIFMLLCFDGAMHSPVVSGSVNHQANGRLDFRATHQTWPWQGRPGLSPLAADHHDHSDVLHGLILQSWLLAAEPLQYKGGIIHSITKKNLDRYLQLACVESCFWMSWEKHTTLSSGPSLAAF